MQRRSFFRSWGKLQVRRFKAGTAHNRCFDLFEAACASQKPSVIVDNTNTKLREFKRYIDCAEKYGYKLQVIRLMIDPAVAAKRNVHGVPAEKVQEMQDRFQDFPGELCVNNNVAS